jgi:outer membrane protein TolC
VRKRLTPEFLLTVIQAQESLADSQRAEIKAVADYNIALSRLSQAAGTLMNLEPIKQGMQNIIAVEQ